MSDIEVGIKLKADGTGLVGEIKGARGEVQKFGTETSKAGDKAARSSRQIDSVERSVSSLKSSALGLGATLAGAFALRDLTNYADTATLIRNKLVDVSQSSDAAAAAQRALLAVANETRTEFSSSVDLYATLQRNARQLVSTDQELVDVVRTINQSFALSGASAASANAAIVQLSQGLASGTLRGDEFNSVAEQAPEILQAVAKYLGVAKGELRGMAAEGQISARVVVEALRGAADSINERFNNSIATVSQSITTAQNNLIAYIGEQNEAFGVTENLSTAIVSLSENIETVASVLAVASAVVGGRYAASLIAAATAKGLLVKQALLATPAVSAMNAAFGFTAQRATVASVATNALTMSVRGLNAAMAFLGGPVGIAIAAGAALLYFTSRSSDATVQTQEHTEKLDQLVNKFRELNAVQRQGELDKVALKEAELKERLLKAQKAYNDEQERQAQRNRNARPATNQFSGISEAVADSNALGQLSTDINEIKVQLEETQTLKERLLSADESLEQQETLTAKTRSEGAKRLEAAIELYENDTDKYSRQLQLKQQLLAGNLTAEEAAVYESLWRQEDVMRQQYDRLTTMVNDYYDAELQKATGNKELIEQLEQEKADKILQIKQNQQENERLLQEQFQLDMSQTNLSFWDSLLQHIEQTTQNFEAMWGNTFDRFTSGIGDAVGTAVVEGENFGDAMKQVAKGALKTLIAGLVELGVKKLALAAIERTIATTSATANTATAVAAGTAVASAYAPAAAMVSLATLGGNSLPAMAGMAATVGLAESLSFMGIAHDGISRVPASHEGTWLLRKDEMVLNPKQADDFDSMTKAAKGISSASSPTPNYNPTINIDATNAVPGMEQLINEKVEQSQREMFDKLGEDFSNQGELSQRLNGLAA